MKKFLSLVLALVMTMSLVTVSAGAVDFTDDSDIDYKEAVDVISALGIVDGYSDDSFRPDGSLTRGAAAKIICNLILGPTTASALSATTAPFKDVPTTNTFAGYITYCSQQGIINGYGDGTFRPTGSLTGNAFMKMLLGALGYDSSIEGYTGANWQVNVIKQAVGIGLDDGNDDFVGSRNVTRQEAALYAFNMLQADMVQYDSKTTVNVNGATVTIAGDKAEVVSTSNGWAGTNDGHIGTADNVQQFAERYFENLYKNPGNDDFGRPTNTWRIKSDEIGTYVNESDLVATFTAKVTKKNVYDAIGGSVVDDLEDSNEAAAVLNFFEDGDNVVSDSKANIDRFADRRDTDRINNDASTGNGTLTEIYVNDDNAVTIVSINTYVFQASDDYNTSTEQLRIAAAGDTDIRLETTVLEGEDFDLADIVEDDYLLVTASHAAAGDPYEVQSVEVAELVTGVVTAFGDGKDVTLDDGEPYGYSYKTDADGEKAEIQTTGGQTALVLDKYGYVIAVDDTVVGGNYLVVSDTEAQLGSVVDAYAYFTDGTEGVIDLRKVDGSTNKTDRENALGWYTYTVDGGDRYSLSSVGGSYDSVYDTAVTDTAPIENGKAALADIGAVTGIRANDRTVYVVVDTDGDVTVHTGVSNAPDVTVNAGQTYTMGYVYRTSNKYATYVYINLEGKDADVDTNSEDIFVFVLDRNATRTDGEDTYYVYNVIMDGAVTTLETEDTYSDYTLYSSVKRDVDTDRVSDMDEVDVVDTGADRDCVHMTNATVDYRNGVMTIGGNTYVINSDSQLNLVIDAAANSLMTDKGADYQADANVGAATIRSTLSGNAVSGYYYVVTEDDMPGNETIDYLFMVVTGATNLAGNEAGTPVGTITAAQNLDTDDNAADVVFTAGTTIENLGTLTYSWYYYDANNVKQTVSSTDNGNTDSKVTGTTIDSIVQPGMSVTFYVDVTNAKSVGSVPTTASATFSTTVSKAANAITSVVMSDVPAMTSGNAIDFGTIVVTVNYKVGDPVVMLANDSRVTVTGATDGQVLPVGETTISATVGGVKSNDVVVTVNARTSGGAVTTNPSSVSILPGASNNVVVSTTNGAKLGDAESITYTTDDGMLSFKWNADKTVLTVTVDESATASTNYTVTLPATQEDGTTAITGVTFTVVVADPEA